MNGLRALLFGPAEIRTMLRLTFQRIRIQNVGARSGQMGRVRVVGGAAGPRCH